MGHQQGELRDSGNWSLNSARASNISELPSLSAQLTLPPLEGRGPIQSHPQDPNGPSFSAPPYNHSPTNSIFAASTTSLHTTPPAAGYQPGGPDAASPSASRRSSFDTRLSNLQLSSPINGTPAASQVSLASTLQRERGIHSTSPAPHRPENGTSEGPNGPGAPPLNNPFGNGRYSTGSTGEVSNGYIAPTKKSTPGPARIAPPIIGAPRFPQGPHPNAPSPTKGFPYAFPDPEFAGPALGRDSRDGIPPGRTSTSSLPGSTSSLYGANSGLLRPNSNHYQNPHITVDSANGSSPFPSANHHPQYPSNLNESQHHHHHHLSNRRASLGLNDSSSSAATPYSRTPELRVSHKLAERKRRKEMKDLFDELRDQLPAERGGKSSKWEVLTKAIEFINTMKQNQDTFIRSQDVMQRELDALRNEQQAYMSMRNEVESLRMEVQAYHHHQQAQAQYHAQSHQPHPHHNISGSGGMQGVEKC
ncbi:hypothetical protein RUND412_002748 [Rhizina undulata]